ncbi:hypothetical protein [Streptomyces sp. 3N207]
MSVVTIKGDVGPIIQSGLIAARWTMRAATRVASTEPRGPNGPARR